MEWQLPGSPDALFELPCFLFEEIALCRCLCSIVLRSF